MGGEANKKIIEKLQWFEKRIEKKYGVKTMILFGSAARTKFRKFNDLDLIIVSDYLRKIGPFKNSLKLYSEWNLDYPVDFICFNSKEFNRLKKQVSIVSEALKEGIVIK